MDPGQNDFLGTVFRKPLYLPDDLVLVPARKPSPRIRDDTIAAKLVTAILYLNISAGMIVQRAQQPPFPGFL